MSEKLSMRKLKEILKLKWVNHLSNRMIGQNVSASPSTISNCVQAALAQGLNWESIKDLDEPTLHRLIYGDKAKSKRIAQEPDWQVVHKEMSRKGVTLQLLWHEYKARVPDGCSYTHYCRGYREFIKSCDVVMRQNHKAGEKCFVDFSGLTVPIKNPTTGEVRKAEIFVASLGASSKLFVLAVDSQRLTDWLGCHVKMFEYYGGVCEFVVPDNLKSGVRDANYYEPDINLSYFALSQHYGFVVLPTRVRHPKDKGKVEQAVLHTQRQILAPLRDRTFFSLHELNKAISELLTKVNSKPFQKLPSSREELFQSLDRPALKPLPQDSYELALWKKAKVHLDYHVEFEGHYYSVPYRYVRNQVELRYTERMLEIFKNGSRIACHKRSLEKGRHTTILEHMPDKHKAYLDYGASELKKWLQTQAPATAIFIEQMQAQRAHPQQAYRASLGVKRLSREYGSQRLGNACQRALKIKSYSYRSLHSILKNNLDKQALVEPSADFILPEHGQVRGAEYFG